MKARTFFAKSLLFAGIGCSLLGARAPGPALPVPSAHSSAPSPSPAPPRPPGAESVLKPKNFKGVLEDRDIDVHAHLANDTYSFAAAMLVHTGISRTRRVLTDYQIYSRIIPFVDKTIWNPAAQTLLVEGGIWGFRLRSWVKFEEPDAQDSRWVHYRIVGGHFRGLEGDITFADRGEKGTLVFFQGAQAGKEWPPKFVIERGAEIVFGFTAKRMRNYVESGEELPSPSPAALHAAPANAVTSPILKEQNDPLPSPRSRF